MSPNLINEMNFYVCVLLMNLTIFLKSGTNIIQQALFY